MRIKKGDTVIVITGTDKGKKGKVLKAFPELDRIVVEGVNVKKKHQRANKTNQKGQIIDRTLPVHVSNVMIIDPSSGKGSRIGKKLVGEKLVRVAQKSGSALE